jgi:hypothetical protein
MTTVWIYVDTDKEVGDVDHLKVFAREELADAWLAEHDPEGKAFSYSVLDLGIATPSANLRLNSQTKSRR